MSTSPVHIIIADNLDRTLRAKGWTREKLANKVGTSKSTLTTAMNPESSQPPTVRSLERYADALKLPPWLLMVPDLPTETNRCHELERVVKAWVSGDVDRPADPLSSLPEAEANLIQAYRNCSATGQNALLALLSDMQLTTERSAEIDMPHGRLSGHKASKTGNPKVTHKPAS